MPKKGQNPAAKKPERTCVACRKVAGKKDLIRLVKAGDGQVKVDHTGRSPGRGAYLCTARACWERGIAAGQVERALRLKLEQSTKDILISFHFGGTKKEVSA